MFIVVAFFFFLFAFSIKLLLQLAHKINEASETRQTWPNKNTNMPVIRDFVRNSKYDMELIYKVQSPEHLAFMQQQKVEHLEAIQKES